MSAQRPPGRLILSENITIATGSAMSTCSKTCVMKASTLPPDYG